MTAWAQLLHFYQPPTQTHDILHQVAEESYRPLITVLSEHPSARLAVNINGVLTELLQEHGLDDVVSGLRELAERGIVEFVGSGKFHPILPLIPDAERKRSIADNAETNRAAFGEAWRPRGFFPPEMCWSTDTLAAASGAHEWVILSGVACPADWPIEKVDRAEHNGRLLHVLFRDDVRSNRISFRETDPASFLDDLSQVGDGQPAYVVTAMDAETFGHHIRGWERDFLGATLVAIENQPSSPRGRSRVEMVLPSDLLARFPGGPILEPRASSWSTTNDDIANGNPYPLWHAPGNSVQALQWEYVDHCLWLTQTARRATSRDAKRFAHTAAEWLQPALHSCQFWWASRRPMWDVSMIQRGLALLNQVLIAAAHAVRLGPVSDNARREAAWRVAAANEARVRIERELIEYAP